MWPFNKTTEQFDLNERVISEGIERDRVSKLSPEQMTAFEIEQQIEAAFWRGGSKGAAFQEVARILANLEHRVRAIEKARLTHHEQMIIAQNNI